MSGTYVAGRSPDRRAARIDVQLLVGRNSTEPALVVAQTRAATVVGTADHGRTNRTVNGMARDAQRLEHQVHTLLGGGSTQVQQLEIVIAAAPVAAERLEEGGSDAVMDRSQRNADVAQPFECGTAQMVGAENHGITLTRDAPQFLRPVRAGQRIVHVQDDLGVWPEFVPPWQRRRGVVPLVQEDRVSTVPTHSLYRGNVEPAVISPAKAQPTEEGIRCGLPEALFPAESCVVDKEAFGFGHAQWPFSSTASGRPPPSAWQRDSSRVTVINVLPCTQNGIGTCASVREGTCADFEDCSAGAPPPAWTACSEDIGPPGDKLPLRLEGARQVPDVAGDRPSPRPGPATQHCGDAARLLARGKPRIQHASDEECVHLANGNSDCR